MKTALDWNQRENEIDSEDKAREVFHEFVDRLIKALYDGTIKQ
jgi:hypothetical protein